MTPTPDLQWLLALAARAVADRAKIPGGTRLTAAPYEAAVRDPAVISALVRELIAAREALGAVADEAARFYAKWSPVAGGHPLIGFACDVELRARAALPRAEGGGE